MFQIKVVEILETYFMLDNFFFRKSCRLRYNVEMYSRTGHATDDSMAHAHCMFGT